MKSPGKAIDLDMVKEDAGHETNLSKLNSGEFSPIVKALEYKRGPLIDGSNPDAEVYECLDLNQGDRLAVKMFKVKIIGVKY